MIRIRSIPVPEQLVSADKVEPAEQQAQMA